MTLKVKTQGKSTRWSHDFEASPDDPLSGMFFGKPRIMLIVAGKAWVLSRGRVRERTASRHLNFLELGGRPLRVENIVRTPAEHGTNAVIMTGVRGATKMWKRKTLCWERY